MAYFPMMVELNEKKVLVIGGGEEGKKKTEILRDFGAVTTLISKDALQEAIELAIECREEDLREQYRNRKVFHRKITIPA